MDRRSKIAAIGAATFFALSGVQMYRINKHNEEVKRKRQEIERPVEGYFQNEEEIKERSSPNIRRHYEESLRNGEILARSGIDYLFSS